MRHYFQWLDGRSVQSLRVSDLAGYSEWLVEEKNLAAGSIARHIASLRVFFSVPPTRRRALRQPSRVVGDPQTLAAGSARVVGRAGRRLAGRAATCRRLAAERSSALGSSLRDWMSSIGDFQSEHAIAASCGSILRLSRQGRQTADHAFGNAGCKGPLSSTWKPSAASWQASVPSRRPTCFFRRAAGRCGASGSGN